MTLSDKKTEYIYKGKKINLRLARLKLPDGRSAFREVVEHRGSVAIIPLLDDGRIVLLRQYRPVIGEWILEIPAGTIEPGERPHECALRELEEETGYRAGKITKLLEFYVSPGYTTEKIYLYKAENLQKTKPRPEPYEFLEIVELTLSEALDKILNGDIRDAKTIIALLYLAYYEREKIT